MNKFLTKKDLWDMILRPSCFGTFDYSMLESCNTCNVKKKCWQDLLTGRRYHE